MSTTGERLVSLSRLLTGTAMEHFLNIALGYIIVPAPTTITISQAPQSIEIESQAVQTVTVIPKRKAVGARRAANTVTTTGGNDAIEIR